MFLLFNNSQIFCFLNFNKDRQKKYNIIREEKKFNLDSNYQKERLVVLVWIFKFVMMLYVLLLLIRVRFKMFSRRTMPFCFRLSCYLYDNFSMTGLCTVFCFRILFDKVSQAVFVLPLFVASPHYLKYIVSWAI